MGLRIEKVTNEKDTGITVVTTGAEFLLGRNGRIRCFQRIPFRREVARIILPERVLPLNLKKENDFACAVFSPQINLALQGDSLIILKTNDDMRVRFKGLFRPAYHADKKGKWLFIDHRGGFGIYPVGEKETKHPLFEQSPWSLDYDMKKGDEIWFSVFPPRPYNWERAYEDLMAHEGNEEPFAYPSRELIKSTARFCQVMVVHSWFWPGGDEKPWLIPEFVPKDMEKFIRVRDDIHRNDMKMVPYFSPYYYVGDDFWGQVNRALNRYKVDGLYYDGISSDFRHSYHFVRKTRRILGEDRILFRHCTTDPLGSARIYCPFIDTYCDYIYRGEAGRADLKLDEFLRWTISGYNISNAVGYWVYTGSTGKPGYVRQAPIAEHIDAALRNEVRLPRTEIGYEYGLVWEPNDGHLDLFDKEYYGKLALLRQRFNRMGPVRIEPVKSAEIQRQK
jgi:hypothetical protein